MSDSLDSEKLEREIKSMYREVGESADAELHFETGCELADRLGYDPDTLTNVPDGGNSSTSIPPSRRTGERRR